MTERAALVVDPRRFGSLSLEEVYRAVPVQNESADKRPVKNGLVLEIPLKRPEGKWSVLSWLVPLRSHRRIYLDEIGAEVFFQCNGRHTVMDVITLFAEQYRLSFLESRSSIMTYLKSLIRRGVIAVTLPERAHRTP